MMSGVPVVGVAVIVHVPVATAVTGSCPWSVYVAMPVALEYENVEPPKTESTPGPPVGELHVFEIVRLPAALVCVNVIAPNVPPTDKATGLDFDEVTAPGAGVGVGVGLGDELPPPPQPARTTIELRTRPEHRRRTGRAESDNTKTRPFQSER